MFLVPGVFKAPEQVDIFIDLRTIEDLYMTKVCVFDICYMCVD